METKLRTENKFCDALLPRTDPSGAAGGGKSIRRYIPIAILLAVYFICRLLFQQITLLKTSFIFPTGSIVATFCDAGEYMGRQWVFSMNHTKFVLGETCSGTTFFSLLVAYMAFGIRTARISAKWLLAAYPVTIGANAMRVLSSIYAHNVLSLLNAKAAAEAVHVITGVSAFLCCFILLVWKIEKPSRGVRHDI